MWLCFVLLLLHMTYIATPNSTKHQTHPSYRHCNKSEHLCPDAHMASGSYQNQSNLKWCGRTQGYTCPRYEQSCALGRTWPAITSTVLVVHLLIKTHNWYWKWCGKTLRERVLSDPLYHTRQNWSTVPIHKKYCLFGKWTYNSQRRWFYVRPLFQTAPLLVDTTSQRHQNTAHNTFIQPQHNNTACNATT